jgi:hypothetical protein
LNEEGNPGNARKKSIYHYSPIPAALRGSVYILTMGLSKIFPCCTQPPGEKDPDERPPKMTETTGASSNAPTADLPPKIPPISNIPSEPSNNAVPPKQEVATESHVDPDISISRKVWNRAYYELAKDEGTKSLVEDYMMAVQKANKFDEDASESELKENMTKMNNEGERESIMKQTLESGRKKIYKSSKLTNAVGTASGFVLNFKSVIDLAIGTNPQTALPWAGVCVGLQVCPGRILLSSTFILWILAENLFSSYSTLPSNHRPMKVV